MLIQYWLLNYFPALASNTSDVNDHRVDKAALVVSIDAIRATL